MLTGRAAFARNTMTDTLAAIVESDPEWGALPKVTPVAVRRVLNRCLEKDPKRDLRAIADARLEIDEAQQPDPAHSHTRHRPKQVARVDQCGSAPWRCRAGMGRVVQSTSSCIARGAVRHHHTGSR